MEPWIQTYSGRRLNILSFEPEDIHDIDVAHALANTCRFNGHTKFFYSVAEHSILAYRIAPTVLKAEMLLHDASEMLISDIPKPVKVALDSWTSGSWTHFESLVYERFALRYGIPRRLTPEARAIDMAMLSAERSQCMNDTVHDWGPLPPPANVWIKPMCPEEAEHEFLKCLEELRKGGLLNERQASEND